MKIKALKKVPVMLNGEIVHIVPGEEYEVTGEIGDALLRGGDAEIISEAPHQEKDAGAVPLNKDAGRPKRNK